MDHEVNDMSRSMTTTYRALFLTMLGLWAAGPAMAGGDAYQPPDFDRFPPGFDFVADPDPGAGIPPRGPRDEPDDDRADDDAPYPLTPGEALAGAWHACTPDARRYCYDVLPGGGRIVRCLVFNWDRLRPVCREGLKEARDALRY
jgi:hypothetical protein